MRRVVALAGAFVLTVTIAGCGGSKSRTLPNVEYFNFVAALQRLDDAGFKIAVPYFPPFTKMEQAEQGRGQLSNYVVVRERRIARDTVALTLTLPRFQGPFGSIGGLTHHSPTVVVPELVGETYTRAWKEIGDAAQSGMWIRVGSVAPLVSGSGLDAFRIASQAPKPGTKLYYEGEVPGRPGVRPSAATIAVTVTAGHGALATEADLKADAALRAAASEHDFGLLFPRTATVSACRIPEGGPVVRYVYGECFTGVDLSGRNAVVVYRQLWDGRDFRGRGSPARPDLEHVWEVTVSPAGRVLSVRNFGAHPPQFVA